MSEIITKAKISPTGIIQQGDIFKNIEFLEYAVESEETIEISKIVFPYVIVLTQACDLQQDHYARERVENKESENQDKYLISVIVAPLYNFEEFRTGKHLSQLDMTMLDQGKRNKSKCENIIKNETKRYHYLQFDSFIPISESVVDFKHYFTVTVNYLSQEYDTHYVCSIESLYRESISQRFSNFLARIGLPDPQKE